MTTNTPHHSEQPFDHAGAEHGAAALLQTVSTPDLIGEVWRRLANEDAEATRRSVIHGRAPAQPVPTEPTGSESTSEPTLRELLHLVVREPLSPEDSLGLLRRVAAEPELSVGALWRLMERAEDLGEHRRGAAQLVLRALGPAGRTRLRAALAAGDGPVNHRGEGREPRVITGNVLRGRARHAEAMVARLVEIRLHNLRRREPPQLTLNWDVLDEQEAQTLREQLEAAARRWPDASTQTLHYALERAGYDLAHDEDWTRYPIPEGALLAQTADQLYRISQ